MSISLRVNNDELSVIKSYADIRGTTVSDVVREAIFEKIEDEFDIDIYKRAIKEHRKNPKTYSHDELLIKTGLK